MTDNEEREKLVETFPSNRKTKRMESKPEKLPEERKVEKVIAGTVRKQKRGFGKKIAETLLEDDSKSVGNYILHDILIPALRSLIFETITGGIEQFLWGGRQSKRYPRDDGRSRVNYGASYRSLDRDRDARDRGRDISRAGRARHDFDEIVLETRGEAENVLEHLVDLTIDYGQATVADLYDLVGATSSFTDNKYGWTELRGVNAVRARGGGYLLNLPRTQLLD